MPEGIVSKKDLNRTIDGFLQDEETSPRLRIFLKSRFFRQPPNVAYEQLPPLNVDILHWFDEDERDLVEDLLLDHALLGDINCLVGIRELDSEKAIEPLRNLLAQNNSPIVYTAHAALTLHQLTGDPHASDYLIYAMKRVEPKEEAVRMLREFPPTPHVIGYLSELLYYPDTNIVTEAICSLFVIYGEASRDEMDARVEVLRLLIRFDDDFRELTIATVRKVVSEVSLDAENG